MNQTRRKFLQKTAVATAASFLTPLTSIKASEPASIKAKASFELLFLQTNWGFNGTRDEFCAAAKKDGYEGIEVGWPGNTEDLKNLFDAVKKHKLQVAFLCSASQSGAAENLASLKNTINAICSNTYQKPLYINCHSGKDYFSYDENKQFIDFTTATTKSTGIKIYHETHRGRMLFAAHVTKQFAERNPDLRLTLDISHWCNVHESLLADQKDTVDYLLQRVDNIHCRIGHAEGPQVNDPRAPEWEKVVNAHLAWWDKVIAYKKERGEQITILTEFGPPDYMPTLPYTRQPVADQWAINVYMMNLLRKRYQ